MISIAANPFASAPRRRSGFTFIEVLFAVILLGIGFIMIAAVFPVAIQQTQSSTYETNGTLVARGAIRQIQAIATQGAFPTVSTTVTPFGTTENAAIGGNAFFSADHRYGWAGFYRRLNATDPYMQVWVVALQNPDFANTGNVSNVPPNVPPIIPSGITAQFSVDPTTGNQLVDITNGSNAIEGAFIIRADSGLVYRLGNADPNIANRYQLAPGYDMNNTSVEVTTSAIPVYIIGRAADPQASPTVFTGPNQDLLVETSFVRLNNP